MQTICSRAANRRSSRHDHDGSILQSSSPTDICGWGPSATEGILWAHSRRYIVICGTGKIGLLPTLKDLCSEHFGRLVALIVSTLCPPHNGIPMAENRTFEPTNSLNYIVCMKRRWNICQKYQPNKSSNAVFERYTLNWKSTFSRARSNQQYHATVRISQNKRRILIFAIRNLGSVISRNRSPQHEGVSASGFCNITEICVVLVTYIHSKMLWLLSTDRAHGRKGPKCEIL